MKRHLVLLFLDFDTRASILTLKVDDQWEENVKEMHNQNKNNVRNWLIYEFGSLDEDKKINNFIDLGIKPFSILAFHNKFFEQVRRAYVIGAYYPALTGVCALGERILNHLILKLRDFYKATSDFKKVYDKESFDNWDVPIEVLNNWGVLVPSAVEEFQRLKEMRNDALHFQAATDQNDKSLALKAIHCMTQIIKEQFSSWGDRPWFIKTIPGELYIKKEWEANPFVQTIYLPSCPLVGYKNQIINLGPPAEIKDYPDYPDKEISDEEFSELRRQYKASLSRVDPGETS